MRMKPRSLATLALLFAACCAAVVSAGCSKTLPPPTVNGAAVLASEEAAAAKAAIRGVDTSLTVSQLVKKLDAAGLSASRPGATKTGLFLPAKYEPIQVDGAFVQTYKFKSGREALGAASTVTTNGAVLGATPEQLVTVNWTGKPAFFRSGDLIVIFVSQLPESKHLARDTTVYQALKKIMGKPFAGAFLDSPGAGMPGAAHSLGASSTTTTQ
jgi:hypothetical protein